MEGTTRFERTDEDRSVGELVQQLSNQTATLVRQELRLAQVERGTPPLPEQAIESTKRDVDEVKAARARA